MLRLSRTLLLGCALLLLAPAALGQQHTCDVPPVLPSHFQRAEQRAAYSCDPAACRPPDCLCASTQPPGGLAPAETPQFILLTYDDCVDARTQALISDLQSGIVNPDGRAIPATYFVSVENCWEADGQPSDAGLIRQLYEGGHEIASHTFTHWTGTTTTADVWAEELDRTRDFLLHEVGIAEEHLHGFRAPYVATNEALYDVLAERGYTYDSSLFEQPLWAYSMSSGQGGYVWAHTLDYGAAVSCGFFPGNECPEIPRPGLWNVPLYFYTDPRGEDAPSNAMYYGAFDPGSVLSGGPILEGEALLELLRWNFEARYHGNRVPVNLFLHASQLTDPARRAVLRSFLQEMLARPDVWAVTVQGLVAWMRDPQPASGMASWFASYCADYPCAAAVTAEPPAARQTLAVVPFPNPAAGDVTLELRLPGASSVVVEVFDALGRRVYAHEARLASGLQHLRLPLAGHPPGLYLYRLRAGTHIASGRLVRR